MKASILFSGLLLGAALGCARESLPAPEKAEITFSTVTGATHADDPEEVRTLEVLVFRAESGHLDARECAYGTAPVSLSVSGGTPLRWYVLANVDPSLTEGITEERHLQERTLLLGRLDPERPWMSACGSLSAASPGETVYVRLDRYACKVTLGQIRVEWIDAFVSAPEIVPGRMVLVDAAGSIPLSGEVSAEDLPLRESPETTLDDAPVLTSEPRDMDASLYGMPNVTPVPTRLAVELRIDGVPNWYPVLLPPMLRNHHYLIRTLTVLGPGADSPDAAVTRKEITFDACVEAWGFCAPEAGF